ncbi:MAG: Glu-tRNA(Gln) amidotransferase GatDE subunit E, partial [Candidatus Thorarchaeota archaeon]
LKNIQKNMPETLERKEKRFIKEHKLSADLAAQIVKSQNLNLYEYFVQELNIDPTLVAVTLENTLVSLHRDEVPVDNLTEAHFEDVFRTAASGNLSSQAIPDVLIYLAKNPSSDIHKAIEATGLGMADQEEIERLIKKIVANRIDYINEQGERAVGGLMGVAMKELRGKADGKTVKALLTREIKRILGK